MEFNRNHYFLIGIVLILLGVQCRYVTAVVLNDKATQFVATKFGNRPAMSESRPSLTAAIFTSTPPPSRRTVELPPWLGFALISAGSICVLHAIAIKGPGGG